MKTVYILQSIPFPLRHYIGITDNLDKRLPDHNRGKRYHTAKYCPWSLTVSITFSDDKKAIAFERYLKSGSGRAFAWTHF